MADERFTFNAQDADALLGMIGQGGAHGPPGSDHARGRQPSFICKTPSGGIAARSGTTVTSVDCDVYYISSGTITSAGFTVPVINLSTTAVEELVYIVTSFAGGVHVAVWEDC